LSTASRRYPAQGVHREASTATFRGNVLGRVPSSAWPVHYSWSIVTRLKRFLVGKYNVCPVFGQVARRECQPVNSLLLCQLFLHRGLSSKQADVAPTIASCPGAARKTCCLHESSRILDRIASCLCNQLCVLPRRRYAPSAGSRKSSHVVQCLVTESTNVSRSVPLHRYFRPPLRRLTTINDQCYYPIFRRVVVVKVPIDLSSQ
jgi:hypothetical protein